MSTAIRKGIELGITIPLQSFLCKGGWWEGKNLPTAAQTDLRLCWDMHLLRPKGIPSLLLVHCSSRYTVLLCGPGPAGWQDLPGLAAEALQRVLAAEGIPAPLAGAYVQGVAGAGQSKTHGRRPVAFLNRAVDDLYALPAGPDVTTPEQPLLEGLLNDMPCRAAGHEGAGTARTFFHTDMKSLR